MSGLLAVFHRDGQPPESGSLELAASQLAYRGDAYQGRKVQGPAALAIAFTAWAEHRDASKQPFTLDERRWLVCAALLTGRRELRAALQNAGEECSSDAPDHELVWRSYRAWGHECVQRLLGEFAFIVWDAEEQTLFSAVDHFGTVPLFYSENARCTLVSNELDAILAYGGVGTELDPEAIADTISFQFQQSWSSTIYRAIRRLPAGHSLLSSPKTSQLRAYWQPDIESDYRRVTNPAALAEEFHELFSTAVLQRQRLSRTGLELSGGMDTSSIAQVLSTNSANDALAAFTHGFSGRAGEREPRIAEQTAQQLGIRLHTSWMDQDAGLRDRRPTCFPPEPQHFLWDGALDHGHKAAAFSPILFSGHGGDMLLGFVEYHWLRQLAKRPLGALADLKSHQQVFGFKRPPLGLRHALAKWQKKSSNISAIPGWLRPEFQTAANIPQRAQQLSERGAQYRQRLGMYYNPASAMIFSRTDASYYRAPVRNTFPFFDLRLWHFVARVPPVPYLVKKALLRLAMKNRLPDELVLRPKQHLAEIHHSPMLEEILRSGVPPWYFEQLEATYLNDYVETATVAKRLSEPGRLSKSEFLQIMAVVYFGAWLDAKKH